ncbi:MAG: fused heptose 7-phosphate kinase/heptose 1-phosphate adenyltransferase [Candidatus Westeberhardia cardiocondylae]|nr:fused heptose 7-phosphate kinase/heptose 1-phosphate adenyltransferase [Candidatus Westeberhardia cardiocondylae]
MEIVLPDFYKVNLLVVGDVMLDRYWYGSLSNISLENSIPIVKKIFIQEYPGGAANVAFHAGLLGCSVHLIGFTGFDDESCILNKQLSKKSVICDFIKIPMYSTIIKLRILSDNKEIVRVDFEKKFTDVNMHFKLLDHMKLEISKAGALILSDYDKGTLKNIEKMISLGNKYNIPVLIDPKGLDFSRYRGATLLTPNVLEFEKIVGPCKNETELVNAGMKLIHDFDLSALLITRSKEGMSLLQVGKTPLHIPARTKRVCDVTGAGDVVISVLGASLASGNSLEESCFLSSMVVGEVIKKNRIFST